MNYVSVVCDLIQMACWVCVLFCFTRLHREIRDLQRNNRFMKRALEEIASKEVPEHAVIYTSGDFKEYSYTIFELGNIIGDIQSEAREVLEAISEEVE